MAEIAALAFVDGFGADRIPEDLQAHLHAAYGVARQTSELEDPAVRTVLVWKRRAPAPPPPTWGGAGECGDMQVMSQSRDAPHSASVIK